MEDELEETSLRHRSTASRHHHQRRRAKKPPPTTNYDDVFGGPPRHAVPFSGVPDDYSELFGGISASCSIPFLDLPTGRMDGWDCGSGESVNGVDYREIFGRCDFSDFAMPYEELFEKAKRDEVEMDMHATSNNGRSSVKDKSGPQTIDPSAFIQGDSNEDNIPYLDDALLSSNLVTSHVAPKEYNTSYSKSSRTQAKELLHTSASVSQHQTGFTCVVEHTKPFPENLPLVNEDKVTHENSVKPKPRTSTSSRSISSEEPVSPEVPFLSITDTNLQIVSEDLPPPAWPPPPKSVINERPKINSSPKNESVSHFSTGPVHSLPPQQEKSKPILKSDSLPPDFDLVPNLKLDRREKPKLKSKPKMFSKSESLPPGFGSELDAMKEAMAFAQARLKTAKELHEKKREGKITELPLKKRHTKVENLEGSEVEKPRVLRTVSWASNFNSGRVPVKEQQSGVAGTQAVHTLDKSGKWRSDDEFYVLTSIGPEKERENKIGITGHEPLVEEKELAQNGGMPPTEVISAGKLDVDANCTESLEVVGEIKFEEDLKREERMNIGTLEVLNESQEPAIEEALSLIQNNLELEKTAGEDNTEVPKEDAYGVQNVEERENEHEIQAEAEDGEGCELNVRNDTEVNKKRSEMELELEREKVRILGEEGERERKRELEKEMHREKETNEEEEKESVLKLEEEKDRAAKLEEEIGRKLQMEKEMEENERRERERINAEERDRLKKLEEEIERELQMEKEMEENARRERERINAEERERQERNRLKKLEEEREMERLEKEREIEKQRKLEEERERERKLEEGRQAEKEREEMMQKLEEEKERERKLEKEIEKERERVRKLKEEREQERERVRKLEEKEREREMARMLMEEKERERKLKEEIEIERERVRKLEEERERERERVRKLEEERELEREMVRKLEEEREQEKERVRKLEEEREKQMMEKEREWKEREQKERDRIEKERELEEEREKQRKEKEDREKLRRLEKEREEKEMAMRLEAERTQLEKERAEERERMTKLQEEKAKERKIEKAKERKTEARKSEEERERERRMKERERKTEGKKSDEDREKARERKSDMERERDRERRARKEWEEREREKEEREREREKDRLAMERATQERAERIAIERITAARQRAFSENREKEDTNNRGGGGEGYEKKRPKGEEEKKERDGERNAREARLRAERVAVERATAEARERAIEKAKAEAGKERDRLERFKSFNMTSSQHTQEAHFKRTQSDSALFQGDGESALRHKARLERQQRTAERAAKALAEKNRRDIMAQREQAERDRIAEHLDADVKRWSSGKEGNLRALLSTLQYILGQNGGWQPIHLTEVITAADVKKAYRRATLYVHPDKLQQRGASIQQKYICEKVFDLLKEAWNKFNSEER